MTIGTPPLHGVDEISVPANALIKFSYPPIDDPLFIHSGTTSIKWSYHLNTQATPTLGGEVVQILSAMVGPITITGQTSGLKTNQSGKLQPAETPGWIDDKGHHAYGPNHELRDIIAWFRKYMTLAGTDNKGNAFRSERAIYFEYAERGWNFMIMPTALKGFRYDKGVIAPEWSITAEIVSSNALAHFAGVTMSSFTDELLTTNARIQGQIGLSAFAQTKAQVGNTNFGQTGDYGSTNPFLNPELGPSALAAVHKMGDNFQGLVAAWATGDFAHFGFGAMLDNNALPKDVDSAYQKLFGNTFLGSLPGFKGGSGSGSGFGSYTYSGSNQQDSTAVKVANAFSGQGLPPELGVAVALHESTLNPDAYQGDYQSPPTVIGDGAVGLFQTFYHSLENGGAGHGASTAHSDEVRAAQAPLTLGHLPPKGYAVTDHYPADHQCADAAVWFAPYRRYFSGTSDDELARWADKAQGVTHIFTLPDNTCAPAFAKNVKDAKVILGQLDSTPSGSGKFIFPAKSTTFIVTQAWGHNGHPGIDIGIPNGTPLVACVDGTVLYVRYQEGGAGKYVTLAAANTKATFNYFHMQDFVVAQGDKVKMGDLIGHSNNTGDSTGPHLHFEFHPNGQDGPDQQFGLASGIDPYPILKLAWDAPGKITPYGKS